MSSIHTPDSGRQPAKATRSHQWSPFCYGWCVVDPGTLLHLISAALILGVLFADVFFTVFDPRGRGGPLNRRQNRLVWALIRNVGRGRPALLALGAPLMVVLTLWIWVVLLVAGFAVAYYPFMQSFLKSPGELGHPAAEAIYYSGYTAATLGFGDLVPDLPWLRVLAPVEAFLGFALLSVSVTYLLAVYRELLAMQTLATTIHVYLEADLLDQLRQPELPPQAERFLEFTGVRVMQSLAAHFHYPVLHYFRPVDERSALPVQLGTLVDLMRPGHDGQRSRGLSHDAFRGALDEYMKLVEKHFIPEGFGLEGISKESSEVERAHTRLLRFMCYR